MSICSLIVCLGICLVSSLDINASVRTRDWDAVLDRYERLCDRCLELKKQEDSGQSVPKRALRQLMKELTSLKNELKEGTGKMSPAQRDRFQRIRSKILSEPAPQPISSPAIPSDPPVIIVTLPPPDKSGSTQAQPEPDTPPVPIPSLGIQFPRTLKCDSSFSIPLPEVQEVPATRSQILGRSFFVSGFATVCACPEQSYGIMCALNPVEYSWGAYVRFCSNFANRNYDYDCLSNGVTESGSIWTSGESSIRIRQWALGPCYRLKPWLRLYAGAGFGQLRTCWEDSSGNWARVTDLSPSGLLLDAGTILNFGKLELNIGLNVTAFKLTSLQLGIGYGF